ncbi:RagB/SusD family nutrient uptake outer membrane protein [Echinicola strongylocentroti]|uniref:RagB/SusD family nutrient uptake outer membrane protein n=1 Tax=Echinicola strongylocentroti TaxID=1795355 RepID=A0A2Z4IHL1_9BACT|nr:RagB/SusD family nutrient uptake outer membrane protein [Echinicola strongylocentroti]AWW30187.1 RagB/SusD family nutrient uptake outer membrane protein [Echinicola strongylocentroti]
MTFPKIILDNIKHSFTSPVVLSIVLLLTISCEDKLSQYPSDAFAQENFWKTESDALIALTGMYRGSIEFGTQVVPSDWWTYCGIVFLELATDNAYDRRGDNSTINRLTNGTLLPNNNVINGYWEGSYKRIAICNDFLENIGGVNMSTEKIQRMTAEARFLRATQYFYMSQFWGSVPLVTETLTPEEANNVMKEEKSVIVKFVMDELSAAVQDLPAYGELQSSEIGRASKQAALAFLGRMYLSEEMFTEASGVYKQIIDLGDNEIDPDYQSLFNPNGENSTENIFSSQFTPGQAPNALPQHSYPAIAGGWHFVNPLGSLTDAYGFDDGSPLSYEDPRFNYDNMGENRDPRFRYNFLWNNSTFGSNVYNCHPDAVSSVDQLTYSKQATRSGYGLRKFFDESFSGNLRNDYGGNIPIIRYAEVLLSYLEAELEAGNPITQELLDLTINAVRGRASVGLPPIEETNAEALRPILRNERRIELAFEGIRLWDIFRWEIGGEVLVGDFWGAPFPDSEKYATTSKKLDPAYRWYVTSKNFRPGVDDQWPVPETEVNINPSLGQ